MQKVHRETLWVLALAAAILLGCSHTPKKQRTTIVRDLPEANQELYSYARNATVYTIGPFDRINLRIWRYDDLSGELTVKEDGTVFIPNVGIVPLGGLTLREAQQSLSQLVGVYVTNPQVDVQPVEVRSKVYYVTGSFKYPGSYPIFKPITLAEAITMAGGTNSDALADGALFSRNGQVYPLDLGGILTARRKIYLQAGDLLYVPSRTEANVFVLGEVNNPGAYPLFSTNGFELMQAIAQAGGHTAAADENEVAIIRRKGEAMLIQAVDLEAALEGDAVSLAALRLRPGDIVWVPPSGIGDWNRALSLISPTLDTLLFRPLTGVRDYFLIQDLIRR